MTADGSLATAQPPGRPWPAALAIGLLLLLSSGFPGGPILALALATLLVVPQTWRTMSKPSNLRSLAPHLFAVMATVGIFGSLRLSGERYSAVSALASGAAAALGLIVVTRTWSHRRRNVAALLVGLVYTSALFFSLPDSVLDVWLLHDAAATAVSEGANPYSNAVSVENGAPTAPEGATIDGYPYPLPTLAPYVVGAWLGDPRLASALAWLAVLSLMLVLARSRITIPLVIAATAPAWPLILWAAWTEPVTLVLLLGALASWDRSPSWSGIMLGLAIASKQYMVVLTPLALLAPVSDRRKRLIWTISSGAAVTLVGLAVGGSAFVDAVVRFHLEQPPRRDSSNLYGLLSMIANGVADFGLLSLAIPIAMGFVVARRVTDAATFARAAILVLTAAFFFGSQAFPNYWFLVLVLTLSQLLLVSDAGPVRAPAQR